ncbi:MAG TPA: DUF1559 domain-containing protein [Pirellulaceae bacterium]|nr:DUF1559 domain-containing protein [Pirellulaceae bacterium]
MRAVGWLLLIIMLVTTTGCGGCSSANSLAEMKRRAIRRDSSENEPTPVAKVAPAPTKSAEEVEVKPVVAAPTPVLTPTAVAQVPTAKSVEPMVVPPVQASRVAVERQRSVANLTKIAEALEAYLKARNAYPRVGLYTDEVNEPILSWRVELLPFLGYEELHRQFILYQPWDSEANKKLIAQMPPEYQSLAGENGLTSYLAIVGPDAAFQVDRVRSPSQYTDGLTSTVMVVEAASQRAVPWTAPHDLLLKKEDFDICLLEREATAKLAITGAGRVVSIAPQTTPDELRAMFTVAAGDTFPAETLLLPASGAALVKKVESGVTTTPAGESVSRPTINMAATASSLRDQRRPLPDALAQQAGKKVLAELYRADYERARTQPQQLELAKQLLDKSEELQADAVGQYLLLNLVQDLGLKAGDVTVTMQAIDELTRQYQVDGSASKFKALEALGKSLRNVAEFQLFLQECHTVLNSALANSDFDLADKTLEIATAAAKRANRTNEINQLVEAKKLVEEARTAYTAVPAAFTTLEQDPANADAHTAAGRYLCFYRREWEQGLTHLAQCGDIKLKVLAQIDQSAPSQPEQQADLGDQWYSLATDARPYAQRSLAVRAGHWYALAWDSLPNGLQKARVQKRLQEVANLTGDTGLQSHASTKRTLPPDE